MILLAGIPSESPMALVTEKLLAKDIPTVFFSQRQILNSQIDWKWLNNKPQGELHLSGCSYNLNQFKSVYIRLMELSNVPEYKLANEKDKMEADKTMKSFGHWLEATNQKVVNKHSYMFSNASKPYQAQIIKQHGLLTPPTLITNHKEEVLAFQKQHGAIIFKSLSGVRSIVRQFNEQDHERLNLLQYCPVQFQACLDGTDVRVHVIGNQVFPTKIKTTGIDYRYAHKEVGGSTELKAFKISSKIAESCIAITKKLGLHFSGIDLRFTTDGNVYCFEVNPMPGYSYYENNTGQDISGALAGYLVG